MIFLTVGTQLPFDRLVRAVDEWCGDVERDDVFGQIADPGDTGYYPKNFEWAKFVDPVKFTSCFEESSMVIGHAGMGTIISGLTLGKPVVIMPRLAELREHRNDHQVATARQFKGRNMVFVADTETELSDTLNDAAVSASESGEEQASLFASDELVTTLRNFIHKR